MRYLITGGCGFIGSHLAEALVATNHQVTVLDDLSTGKFSNVRAIEKHPNFRAVIGSVTEESLVNEAMRDCDAVFHLASAVGVRLIMNQPVQTIETIVTGTQVVLKAANRYRKPLLLTSTSEVYGKSTSVPFVEDGDRLEGPTTKHRWAYACAKALDEFLAMAYWKTSSLPIVVVRLFNTVGPRQSDQYGMVIPTFVNQSLQGLKLQVHGSGQQSRCFCHVSDVVRGLVELLNCTQAYGEVVNLGSTEEVTMVQLAHKVIAATRGSNQTVDDRNVEFIPYQAVYGEGFEDMQRRVPSIDKALRLIGWRPQKTLDDILQDIIASRSSLI